MGNKIKTARQINTEAGLGEAEILTINNRDGASPIRDLNEILAELVIRLAMLGYKFKINKNKGIVKWWK